MATLTVQPGQVINLSSFADFFYGERQEIVEQSETIHEVAFSNGNSIRFHLSEGVATSVDLLGASGEVVAIITDVDMVFTGTTGYTVWNWLYDAIMVGPNSIIGGDGADDLFGGITGPSNLYGGAGNDKIYASRGDDYIDGGAGNDNMSGGPGDDLYIVDSSADVVAEDPRHGHDVVRASASFTLTQAVDDLYLTGRADLDGTGSQWGNKIFGNAGRNVLDGGGGKDMLVGRGGDDVLIGGAGNDKLVGGAGNDTYVFSEAAPHRGRVTHYTDRVVRFGDAEGNQDLLDLSAYQTGFDALDLQQQGANTVIQVGGDTIILVGVSAATIGADDFLF